MSVLIAQNLKKQYKSKLAVKDISIEVSSSEIIGLLGPNGAGKTTSFYMIVGLIKPTSGQIFIDTKEITKKAIHQRAKMGLSYLPQETSIFRKLTVNENIMSILQLRKDLGKKQRKEQLDILLSEFGLTNLNKTKASFLSGGEKRRVEIARSLATKPKFILLDEPFAGIDPISVIDIKKIILSLKERGIGVLITDHNVRETLTVCERSYIVNNGHVIAQGTPHEIVSNDLVKKVYLGEEFKI